MDNDEYKEIFLGNKIGSGCYRDVYNCRVNPKWVVKVAKDDIVSNVLEWIIWNEVEYCKELSKWFAPCVKLSDNGKILIQYKAEQGLEKDYPKQLPHFFTDIKKENFGFINGKLVCFDYGSLPFTKYFNGNKLKKAIWC